MASAWKRHKATIHPAVHVVLEEGENNWCAYVPSVPVVVATGKTCDEVRRNIQEALTAHLTVLHEQDLRDEAEEAKQAAAQ
jgi:predicted RNase H-like HicB family nuclease